MASYPQTTRRHDRWERVRRWARYRWIIPLKRSRHPPDYVARSVSVGMFWALTPSVGIQMAIVLLHWGITRKLRRWDFNLIHAMAWTWVTNVFTLLPFYYLFYVTGQTLMGRWNDLAGYDGFVQLWQHTTERAEQVAAAGAGLLHWLETVLIYTEIILGRVGLTMVIGCLPWAVLGAWLSYRWSLNLVVHHRRAQLDRRLARKQTNAGADGADASETVA